MSSLRLPLPEAFFCDGPSYLITSTSLGQAGLDSHAVARMTQNETDLQHLLRAGVALPLFFPGDCAFDKAVVVIGDLGAEAEAQWLGRLSSRLNIPCGELLIVSGGGDGDELEAARSQRGLNGYTDYFARLQVPPGDYRVDVYAFVSSMSVDFLCEDHPFPAAWQMQRPRPLWLDHQIENGYCGELSDHLISYLLQLTPLGDQSAPLPERDAELGWPGVFTPRYPEQVPQGLTREAYLSGA